MACGRERAEPLSKGFCCCCSAREGVAGRNGPQRWVAKDAHFPAVAREETSSPQKNAYRVPGLRFTQRTGDMVYIGFEDLLPFPLLQWPLSCLLLGMKLRRIAYAQTGRIERKQNKVKGGVVGLSRLIVLLLPGQKHRA